MIDHHEPSRREFLTASALGVLGVASLAHSDHSRRDTELLYVGAYTEASRIEGIFLVEMDTRFGALRLVGSMNAGPNPSFLAIHPNGRVLYAVNEVEERDGKKTGAVSAFSVARDSGSLTRINEQLTQGGAPCYVSVDRAGRAVLVANYVGGSVALFLIQPDGAALGAASHVDQHQGKGPNAERQEAAHAHCIVPDPTNRFALSADLGIDRVLVYRLDLDAGVLSHVGDAQLRPGAGPRHLTFHPKLPIVYVANELDSTVTALRFVDGKLTLVETRSTLPSKWTGTSYAADIHVAPSGRTLYVSNRGHNSIAVFSVAASTGALSLEQTIPTEGDWPRNFSLDPTARWLLVGNQRSGSVVVFARDQASGRLSRTNHRLEVPSPACLRFRSHAGVAT
jgi:6-phosphogluconolactonase